MNNGRLPRNTAMRYYAPRAASALLRASYADIMSRARYARHAPRYRDDDAAFDAL